MTRNLRDLLRGFHSKVISYIRSSIPTECPYCGSKELMEVECYLVSSIEDQSSVVVYKCKKCGKEIYRTFPILIL